MLAHDPVTVIAPGTLTSMMSPSWSVAPASNALTSSYLAWSWLRSPMSTKIGVVIVSCTNPGEMTFTAVTCARKDGGRVAAIRNPS